MHSLANSSRARPLSHIHVLRGTSTSCASSLLQGIFVCSLLAIVAGCGTVYVNKEDHNPEYRKETDFTSNRNTEATYRRIYRMLYRCTSGYYRVEGDYDPGKPRAEISVDTGVGFQNDAYLADSHVMRIVIDADGLDTSRVRIMQTSRHGAPYSDAMASWVNEGSDDCAAGSWRGPRDEMLAGRLALAVR